jgi:hypothetical protein
MIVYDVWRLLQKLANAKGKGKYTFDAATKQDTKS